MLRKRPSALNFLLRLPLAAIIGFVLVLLLLAMFATHPGLALFLVITGCIAAAVYSNRAKRKMAWQKTANVINQHLDQLARKRVQLVRQDGYGKTILDKWRKELGYFIDNHIWPALTAHEQRIMAEQREQLICLIEQRACVHTQQQPVFAAFSDTMTPTEFEAFCAEQLRLAGWSAQVTIQSRDQGIDVIAEKAGKRVVLQCKLYSGPVGNGAVQEIAAGKAHESADYGAVVTNSRYTAPAEQLASTNGILLLHYSDLGKLDELLGLRALKLVSLSNSEPITSRAE